MTQTGSPSKGFSCLSKVYRCTNTDAIVRAADFTKDLSLRIRISICLSLQNQTTKESNLYNPEEPPPMKLTSVVYLPDDNNELSDSWLSSC